MPTILLPAGKAAVAFRSAVWAAVVQAWGSCSAKTPSLRLQEGGKIGPAGGDDAPVRSIASARTPPVPASRPMAKSCSQSTIPTSKKHGLSAVR